MAWSLPSAPEADATPTKSSFLMSATLFFASPLQVNFLVPAGTAIGTALGNTPLGLAAGAGVGLAVALLAGQAGKHLG